MMEINFVFDEWDIKKGIPTPNKPYSTSHNIDVFIDNDIIKNWNIFYPNENVYLNYKINPCKINEVTENPNILYYYPIWYEYSLLRDYVDKNEFFVKKEIIHLINTNKNFRLLIVDVYDEKDLIDDGVRKEFLKKIHEKTKITEHEIFLINKFSDLTNENLFFRLNSNKPESIYDIMHLAYDTWDSDNFSPIKSNMEEFFSDVEAYYKDVNSFTNFFKIPHPYYLKYPIEDVNKYKDRKFFYILTTLNGGSITKKILNYKSPFDEKITKIFKENKNLNIIISNEQEIEDLNFLKQINYWSKINNLDQSRIYILNNNTRLEEYKSLLNAKFNVYTTSILRRSVLQWMDEAMGEIDFIEDKRFLFLCHNRRPKAHRVLLLSYLRYYNILDSVDWSISEKEVLKTLDVNRHFYLTLDESNSEMLKEDIDFFRYGGSKKSYYEQEENFFNDDGYLQKSWDEIYLKESYENSYFNIVTESLFSEDDVHISEKSLKPFLCNQFPLILGSPFHTQIIKEKHPELDFFDDVINHDYDKITNHKERMFAFVNEIKRINDNKDFFIEFYKNNKERFLKNRESALNIAYTNPDLDWLMSLIGKIENDD